MRVSQLAKTLDLSPDTVRFYTRIKMLQPQKNSTNGYWEYSEKDVLRMRFISSARQIGFSVNDIKKILAETDQKQSPCPLVQRLIEQRLSETSQRIEEMLLLRKRMYAAINEWNLNSDQAPIGKSVCDLIESSC
ncbi:MAG: DNA-binding transcriptional MerR regulator [Oceanicoccus sp.]|jgi:DNA-binding transcriptional MerR regulator